MARTPIHPGEILARCAAAGPLVRHGARNRQTAYDLARQTTRKTIQRLPQSHPTA